MIKNTGARMMRINVNLFARFMTNIDFKERMCQSAKMVRGTYFEELFTSIKTGIRENPKSLRILFLKYEI